MNSFDQLQRDAQIAQRLWSAQQEARAEYARARRRYRTSGDPVHQSLADEKYSLHRALVEASAVRLSTAWEVFLRNLLAEYLSRRPVSFRRAWGFQANSVSVGSDAVDRIVTEARQPFQDLNRAKQLLRYYLGPDLFSVGKKVAVDTKPVEDLVAIRNAVVHTAGSPTRQFRNRLSTRKAAHVYLTSRPGPVGSLPVTQFERLLTDLLATAATLYQRTWARPRPVP